MVKTWLEILLVSTRLGFTSFGGPVAHLAYFKDEYINRRKWLNEKSYADLIALCQFLPGPASSQVGIAIGMVRGGIIGGIISWFGFTMPSVIALVLFAHLLSGQAVEMDSWIHGLKLVAVAVVLHAILGMGKKLTPDLIRQTMAISATVLVFLFPTAFGQIAVILLAALVGYMLYRKQDVPDAPELPINIPKMVGVISWGIFFGLLIFLPLFRNSFDSLSFAMFDTFYRVGSIVFGGGHVVLPMMEREVVPVGWITEEAFLAGYGAAQAVPGPLFTLSSYLGAYILGVKGAMIATFAMFFPSFLLLIGTLPFWNVIRKKRAVQAALMGVNAAVVGILIAAFYDPVWTSTIETKTDFAIALTAFAILQFWKKPAWFVVIVTAIGTVFVEMFI